MRRWSDRRYLALIAVALAALAAASHAWPLANGATTLAAPGAATVDGVMVDGSRIWVWTPAKVLLNLLGDTSTVEVKAPGGDSLVGVLGMEALPQVFITSVPGRDEAAPLIALPSSTVLLWNEGHLYRHFADTTNTVEVLKPDGTAITGVRGVTPHATESAVLIWTATNVYKYSQGRTAAEVAAPGGGAVAGTKGMAAGSTGTYLWTGGNLFLLRTGSRAVELLSPGGTAIGGVRGVVVTQSRAYVWTAGNVFVHQPEVVPLTRELKAPDGSAIAGLKGLAGGELSFGPGDSVVLWNAGHVYRTVSGREATEEMLAPAGGAIAGVRGVIGSRAGISAFDSGAVIWNATNVYKEFGRSTQTVELAKPDGGALAGVLGAISQRGNYYLSPSTLYLWSATALFRLGIASARGVQEVIDAAGGSIAGVRGAVSGGDEPVVWTSGKVYDIFGARANELTRPDGTSAGGAWGVLSQVIRTNSAVYRISSLRKAAEIRAPDGTSIGSAANPTLAVVSNSQGRGLGVGAANTPAAYTVDFVEMARASREVEAGASPGMATVTAEGPGYQIIGGGGVVGDTSPERSMMLLFGSAPQLPLFLPVVLK